jgi:hypothetical protein
LAKLTNVFQVVLPPKDKDVFVRIPAAQSFGQMGAVSQSALPALRAALTDQSWKEGQALHGEQFLSNSIVQAAQNAMTAISDAARQAPSPPQGE